ncbi:MAG: putative Clathrin heavy chain 1, partial [Streblomastix strix]
RATALRTSAGIIYTDPNDFPVAIEYSERCGLILLVSAKVNPKDGLIGVNVQGQVLQIGVDERAIVPYVTQKLQNVPLAVRIAGLAKLSGCEDLFIQQFEANFLAYNYGETAKMAVIAPGGVLRTLQFIQRFKTALPIGGGAPPLMQYLAVLLSHRRLNEQESLELVGPVVQQGRKDMAERWLRDGKITASEPLGNFLRTVDLNFALSENLSCDAHEKAVQTYAELGELGKLIAYCKQTGYRAPYGDLLRGLCQNPEGPLIETSEAMEIMFQKELIKEQTGLMLEVLKADLPKQSRLQTRFFEILLLCRPDIVNVIFGRSLFHEYDQSYIGGCCETAGLFHRALEHYTELADILRCIAHTDQIPAEFIVSYVGEISKQKEPKYGYECLRSKNNVRLCTDIANSWAGKVLDRREIIHIFEENKMIEAVYLHLQSIASTLEENDLEFSFIRAAVQMQQLKEVEIVVRDSTHYDAVEMRDFLMEKNLPDSKSFTHIY